MAGNLNPRQFGEHVNGAPMSHDEQREAGEARARAAQRENGGAPLDRYPSSNSMHRAGTLWRRG